MAINEKDFFNIIKAHMKVQPYVIICSKCGATLNYSADVAFDLDLTIVVEPHECIE